MTDSEHNDLLDKVRAIPEWYHTLELPGGLVTPGWFDLRSLAPQLPFPALAGKRCLDVGTFDGFWAFEMERRGAAEVVAIDVVDPREWDWPVGSQDAVVAALARRKAAGSGFLVAKEALGSSVSRHELSVYDADPSTLGTFDFVYVGSLLLHLRDPVRALERLRAVCTGELLVVDAIDLPLSKLLPRRPVAWLDGVGRPWWWKPNAAGLAQMVRVGGFDIVGRPNVVYMPTGVAYPKTMPRVRQLRRLDAWQQLVTTRRGEPHAAVRGRPRAY